MSKFDRYVAVILTLVIQGLLIKISKHKHLFFTETGWAISSTCSGLNMSLSPPSGAAGKPVPGWNGNASPPLNPFYS